MLAPERQIARDILVLIDASVDLHRTENDVLFRELLKHKLAEVFSVASCRHKADQVVFIGWSEWSNEQKFRTRLARQSSDNVSRLNWTSSAALSTLTSFRPG